MEVRKRLERIRQLAQSDWKTRTWDEEDWSENKRQTDNWPDDETSERDRKSDQPWKRKGGYAHEGGATSSTADQGSNYDSEDRAGAVQEYTSKKHRYASVVLVSAGVTTLESGAYSLKRNKQVQNFLDSGPRSEHPEALRH